MAPCLLLLFFLHTCFENISEKKQKIVSLYIVNLVLIHACIVFIQIYYNASGPSLETIYEAMKCLLHFSFVGCFGWLNVLNNDVRKVLKTLERSEDIVQDSATQSDLTLKDYLNGFGLPLFFTASIAIMYYSDTSEHYYRPGFEWSEPHYSEINIYHLRIGRRSKSTFVLETNKNSLYFTFEYFPIVLLLILGLLRFGQTFLYCQEIASKKMADTTMEAKKSVKIVAEFPAFERFLFSLNRFKIYFRVFLVMLISCTLFILYDSTKMNVLTIINGLHIIAFVTMINKSCFSRYFENISSDVNFNIKKSRCRFHLC